MHAPVLIAHRRTANAASRYGTGRALRRVLSRLALGVALGSFTVGCTLTQGDYKPVVTEADPVLPAPEPAPPAPEGCTLSLECPDGFECAADACVPSECDPGEDASCVVDVCVDDDCEPGCEDGQQGPGETGVDCGGPCAPCAPDAGCVGDAPVTAACPPASCQDQAQNGAERGVDCGGGACPGCGAGASCAAAIDCASGYCGDGRCAAPSCNDTVQNGDESDVDCGGGCPACATGLICEAPADCSSAVCDDVDCAPGIARCCQAPSCSDGVRNGGETAVDCGAEPCGRCGVGAPCTEDSQCASNVCGGGSCVELCSDGVPNGNEGAADCGGTETGCPRCDDGQSCGVDSDCASGACDAGTCISCTDGSQTGDEGGVDCGGSEPGCPACPRCTADNSIDLRGAGAISTIPGDSCARITVFPSYAPTRIDSFDAGTFPVPFTYRQECSAASGANAFGGPFATVTLVGLSVDCPVIFDFAGPSAPFGVRWF